MRNSRSIVAGLAVVVVLFTATAGLAATLTVTNAGDSGPGSLRAAITVANESNASDNIIFTSSLNGATITLKRTLPAIVKKMTITGPDPTSSAGITIDGGGKVQIMQVNGGAALTLQYLTLANGTAAPSIGDAEGGAVTNRGTLTISGSTVSANRALLGKRGHIVEGGAISNKRGATLTITNSTFSANSAAAGTGPKDGDIIEGGAIYNQTDATLVIADSTFSTNSAAGGSDTMLSLIAGGGAISNENAAEMTITNCTFSQNRAEGGGSGGDGGAIENFGTSTISFVTFAGNQSGFGGAIMSRSKLQLKGSILAANEGLDEQGNCSGGGMSDSGYNLSDDGSCKFTADGSKNNVPDADIDLGTLGNNGGPTLTIALTSTSSVAVNQVPKGLFPPTDQRGFVRPAPGQVNCDIGAFELGAQPPP